MLVFGCEKVGNPILALSKGFKIGPVSIGICIVKSMDAGPQVTGVPMCSILVHMELRSALDPW